MSGLKSKPVQGVTDNPTNQDLFDIQAYTEGVSEFVAFCSTPMTIAIQGDWGTGKTSMMQRIKNDKKVQEECVCVDFNTWEYSQFDLGNNLPIVFYAALIEKMGGKDANDDVGENVRNALKGILMFALSFAENNAKGPIFSAIAGGTKAAVDAVEPKNTSKSLVEATEDLKKNFEKVLRSRIERDNKNRMVIFIDDLDRIEPQRAVELMEILKVLLEVEQCVFVLAIDYDVVVRGIKAKYGKEMDEKKARSFFDKIIQVPFALPVGSYNIENYVCELLKMIAGKKENRGLLDQKGKMVRGEVIDLIRSSVGCNPRAIKRLINSFLLLKLIRKSLKEESDENNDLILFATLCLQMSYDKVYEYLLSIRESKEDIEKLFKLLTGPIIKDSQNDDAINGDRIKEQIQLEKYSESELYSLSNFFTQFQDLLSGENGDEDSNQEDACIMTDKAYQLLKKALRYSSSTSTGQNNIGEIEQLPAKIRQVHKVVKVAIDEGKGFNEAVKQVAEELSINPSSVRDKCCRQLKSSTEEFSDKLEKFIRGDKQGLIDLLTECNPRYKDQIKEIFSEL